MTRRSGSGTGSDEHELIEQREDRRVSPDAERDGEDGRQGEHRRCAELPGSVADGTPDALHCGKGLQLAPVLLQQGCIAELASRR